MQWPEIAIDRTWRPGSVRWTESANGRAFAHADGGTAEAVPYDCGEVNVRFSRTMRVGAPPPIDG